MLALCPILREDYVAAGLFDPAPASIDVASLLEGYRRRLPTQGFDHRCGRDRYILTGRRWRVATSAGELPADIIVNAAGAWADGIAKLAGVRPVGLEPRRRTAVLVRDDSAEALSTRALVIDVDEQFIFGRKAEACWFRRRTNPQRALRCAEELDVAIAIDRFTAATTTDVRSVRSKWAGLRSFVADRNWVVDLIPGTFGFSGWYRVLQTMMRWRSQNSRPLLSMEGGLQFRPHISKGFWVFA